MQHQTALLLALAKGIWAFDYATAGELSTLANRVLGGESLELLTPHATAVDPAVASKVYAAVRQKEVLAGVEGAPRAFRMGWYSDLDNVPAGSTAIISVQGVIMKHGFCGIGSMERANRVIEAANHPNVGSILLEIDTPGGQVDGLSTLWDAILYARTVQKKPVIAFINDGSCYSAGYNTASACTEIWASHKTCGVGSIGVMCQFTDSRKADKKAGYERIVVYATLSTDKNQAYHKALDGDTSEIVKELDMLNADFHEKIRSQRKAKIKHEKAVFTGKTFTASEGVKLGLVDTIGSMQAALERCAELGLTPGKIDPTDEDDEDFNFPDDDDPTETTTKPPINSNMKSFPFLAAVMAIAPKDFQNNAEGAHLQVAHLDAIEARLAAAEGFEKAATAATTERDKVQAELTTATTERDAANKTVASQATELVTLKEKLAKGPGGTTAKKDGQEAPIAGAEESEMSEWEKLDADMLADMKKNSAQFIL